MDAELECVSREAACAATDFLVAKCLTNLAQYGHTVHLSMTPDSIRRFSVEAFERGWAGEGVCRRLAEATR